MSVGMGLTMAPATESVMGSLPREKAGVGSAVNDTTRQVGGALGVAAIGSIVASVYAANVDKAASAAGVTGAAAETARGSLGGALKVATSLGDKAGDFGAAARDGFVSGLSAGLRLGTAVVLLAALVAWRFLPARAHDPLALDVVHEDDLSIAGAVPAWPAWPARPGADVGAVVAAPLTARPPRAVDETRKPGRPRTTPRADRAILEATLDLVGETGLAGLTVDAVAARAGVSKATIYRRWDSKEALVLAAWHECGAQLPAPDTGSLRGDLEQLCGAIRDGIGTGVMEHVFPQMLAAATDQQGAR